MRFPGCWIWVLFKVSGTSETLYSACLGSWYLVVPWNTLVPSNRANVYDLEDYPLWCCYFVFPDLFPSNDHLILDFITLEMPINALNLAWKNSQFLKIVFWIFVLRTVRIAVSCRYWLIFTVKVSAKSPIYYH